MQNHLIFSIYFFDRAGGQLEFQDFKIVISFYILFDKINPKLTDTIIRKGIIK